MNVLIIPHDCLHRFSCCCHHFCCDGFCIQLRLSRVLRLLLRRTTTSTLLYHARCKAKRKSTLGCHLAEIPTTVIQVPSLRSANYDACLVPLHRNWLTVMAGVILRRSLKVPVAVVAFTPLLKKASWIPTFPELFSFVSTLPLYFVFYFSFARTRCQSRHRTRRRTRQRTRRRNVSAVFRRFLCHASRSQCLRVEIVSVRQSVGRP